MYGRLDMHCDVIVWILGHHNVVGCYDDDVLVEIEQEMQITRVKLQHWTSRKEHVVIHVCMFGMQFKDFYMHYGYMYAFHSIDVMVTYMIDAS